MAQDSSLEELGASHWGEVIRSYLEMMDDLMPYLAPAEQIVYQRLFRLSYVRQSPFTACRYAELAEQCGLSIRTLQRALKGLRQKKLVKTVWQSHGATTFHVQLLSTLPHRPAFLPRQRRGELPARLPSRPARPPIYDAFSAEDRALFLSCKRALSPAHLVELTEEAVEWLTERADGDPEGFADDLLRDKVDELVVREVFGPDRQERYRHLFVHLYKN
ncbi:MAG: helix-turn-helix domain-containing protein [Deltaproteobacteria bacterium]|nr:helix-turn-helix domain-containing protein [Deltaproteobacteria bacterium]